MKIFPVLMRLKKIWGGRGESEVVNVYLSNEKEILNIFNIFLPSIFRSIWPNSKDD